MSSRGAWKSGDARRSKSKSCRTTRHNQSRQCQSPTSRVSSAEQIGRQRA
jgi:hypothetical protein